MKFILVFVVFVLSACADAQAGEVTIYDRQSGESLPVYWHRGRMYVAGEPGHEYEIRIRSRRSSRTLAVTTVDGVNVISGETGATDQAGYVLDPYGYARIEGWRKSLAETAAFYFTRLPDSYAARTGRPDNVGVIGVALFRERTPCCVGKDELSRMDDATREAPAAPQRSDGALQERSKLGTGHGRREYSQAQYTDFERVSNTPDETIVIYYDSRRNLVARGVIPSDTRYANKQPNPFPGGFVPDP